MSKIRDISEKNAIVVNLDLIDGKDGRKSYVEINEMLFGKGLNSKKPDNKKIIIELKNRTMIIEKLEETARKFAGAYRDDPSKQWDISLYDVNALGVSLYALTMFSTDKEKSEGPIDGLLLIPWSNIVCVHTFYDDNKQ